jgi:DegV family protein with EDD domain
MSKIGVLVCGNSGIDYIDHEYDIPVLRSILFVGENEYEDFIDITASEFYDRLISDPSLAPSTAQVATGVALEKYKAMVEKGYTELLVISISEHLSGTYQGCVLAASMLDDVKVTVFDSKTLSYPEAKMALDAAKMAKEGKTLEEIIEHLEFIRDHSMIWFSVETLKYLVKNGRLSGASGFVGSLMKIKPMLEVTKEGKVESIEKIRTSSKATLRVIEKLLEEIKDKDVEVFIVNTNNEERVKFIAEEVLKVRPDIRNINVYPLTPVVGAHAGPGTVGIGYILKK